MVVVTSDPLGWVSVLTSVFLAAGVGATSLASRLSGVTAETRPASLSTDEDTGTDLFGFLGTTGLKTQTCHVTVILNRMNDLCFISALKRYFIYSNDERRKKEKQGWEIWRCFFNTLQCSVKWQQMTVSSVCSRFHLKPYKIYSKNISTLYVIA